MSGQSRRGGVRWVGAYLIRAGQKKPSAQRGDSIGKGKHLVRPSIFFALLYMTI